MSLHEIKNSTTFSTTLLFNHEMLHCVLSWEQEDAAAGGAPQKQGASAGA